MADDKTKRGSPDNKRVNIHEPYELRQWAQKWGVTSAEVITAVNAVGTSAAAVEAYLKGKKK